MTNKQVYIVLNENIRRCRGIGAVLLVEIGYTDTKKKPSIKIKPIHSSFIQNLKLINIYFDLFCYVLTQ